MPDPDKKPPSATADRPVAGNNPNTLAPTILRLPLGKRNARTHPDAGPVSIFTLRNPTHFGGTLTITSEGAKGKKMQLRRGRTDPVLAESSTGELRYDIPKSSKGANHHGIYHLSIELPKASASARLIQTGFSRQSDSESAAPFVPWNFWYWPTATKHMRKPPDGTPEAEVEAWKRAREVNYWTYRADRVLGAFADLEGRKPDDSLRDWETDHHQRHYLEAGAWEGHCSWVAVASVLFEQPVKKHAGSFDYHPDDLELLAGEFAGVFAHTDELPDGFRLTRYPVGSADLGILDVLKPEGENDEKELQSSLDRTYPEHEGTRDDFKERFKRDYGGDPSKVKNEFGVKAAQFFVALQYELRGAWGIYVGDFRAGEPKGNAAEVWTHALFMYSAEFIETEPKENDDKRYDVECTLYCNRDVEPPASSGAPAKVKGNALEPLLEACLTFDHKYRLSFDDAGEVRADSSGKPAWLECRSRVGGKLYAPRYLKQVVRPLKTIDAALQKRRDLKTGANDPAQPPRHGIYGNPLATWGLIDRGLLRLRARYK